MIVEKIKLWEDEEKVNLTTYILDNSEEMRIKKRPAVIVCPGGAYLGTSDREAEPVAMKFVSEGYNAFVLRYTTYFKEWVSDFNNPPKGNEKSKHPQPLFDVAKAIMLIKENADKWNIDSNNITVCGFSAGAHLTATLGTSWDSELLKEKFGVDSEMFRPKSLILGYPVTDYICMKELMIRSNDPVLSNFWEISNMALFGEANPSDERLKELSPAYNVSCNTPETFIWHTANDELVAVENSLNFAKSLSKNKIPYDLHIFEDGPHGLSLCNEATAAEDIHVNKECEVWFNMAISWLKKNSAR